MNLPTRWFNAESFNEASVVIAPGMGRWVIAAIVAGCLLAVVLSWRSAGRLLSIRRRLGLFVPRFLAIALIGCALLQPELELRRSIRKKNTVAVLVDASASMGIRVRPGQASREEAVVRFFREHGAFFADLEREMDVKYYALAEAITPIRRDAVEKGIAPSGKRSRIIGAIRDVAASLREARLKAVLLFTDGVDTEDDRPSCLKNAAAPPVHVFFPGEEGFKDIEIAEVRRDEFAFIRTPWTATAILRVRGYGNQKVPVTLKQGDSVIQSQIIQTSPVSENYPVEIRLTPNQIGKFFYTLSVPRDAEEAVPQNNEMTFGLNVIRDKIRILQVCGMPSWDSLFLRRTLKLNPTVDLVSLFILRTPTDINLVPAGEMSLIPFPVNAFLRDDLHSFDAVVFQNFAYAPYGVAPFLPFIRDYVKEERGAFLMIGGDQSFAGGHYFATPIEEILPADVPAPGDASDSAPFRARLTPEGKRHPITTLEPDDRRNQQVWEQLPELNGYNFLGAVKRDAVVLADHPVSGRPILSVAEIGTGRTMAIAVDTLWRWNFLSVGAGRGNRHYLAFWSNAVRWLIHDPSFDLVRLSTPRDACAVGEAIDVTAAVQDHTYKPVPAADLSYCLRQIGQTNPKKSGEARTDAQGRWEYRHSGAEPGLFQLEVRAKEDGRELGTAEISLLVQEDRTEYFNPAVATDAIAEITSVTGGRSFDLSDDRFQKELKIENPKVVQLLDRRSHPLWNNGWVLGAVLALLSLEWALRRRLGLA